MTMRTFHTGGGISR
ncbi:MAG: hypothetical protein R2709_00145 [Marmoricola sp.]